MTVQEDLDKAKEPTKVFVVKEDNCSDWHRILGVFSTRPLAEHCVDEDSADPCTYNGTEIEEWTLDAEEGASHE